VLIVNENLEILIYKLTELKNTSIKSTPDTIMEIMKNYNMLFLGSKFNTIYSNELHHHLKTISNLDIDNDKFNILITTACDALNMKFEKLIAVQDIGKSNPYTTYQITLWE
jgi:hypothetical protein